MKVFNNGMTSFEYLAQIFNAAELSKVKCQVLESNATSFKVMYNNETFYINKNYTSFHPDENNFITADIRYFQQY
jgi:hypothetical protein